MTLEDLAQGPLQVVVRTAIVYLFLVIVLRMSGKREVGQMSILELIVVRPSDQGERMTTWRVIAPRVPAPR